MPRKVRRAYSEILENLNKSLSDYNQELRIVFLDKNSISLSNNKSFNTVRDRRLLIRRITLGNVQYLFNFDIIYGLDAEKSKKVLEEISKEGHKKGGVSCQKQHGEKIRKNNLTAGGWNKGIKNFCKAWNKGLTKFNHPSIQKIAEQRKGEGNPMYGTTYTEEERKIKSDLMKDKILKGEFTPNIHNSRTHWQVKLGDKKFRSSWEAAFYSINPNYEFEALRIPYIVGNITRIYIVDFVNHTTKHLVEIKPNSHRGTFKEKEKAASKWALENGYIFEILSENWFFDNWNKIPLHLFDNITQGKLKGLYETYKKRRNR